MAIANPQSFNHYAYVQNDPVNLTDSTGLFWAIDYGSCQTLFYVTIGYDTPHQQTFEVQVCNVIWVGPSDTGDPVPHGGGPQAHRRRRTKPKQEKKKCDAKLTGNAEVDVAARFIFAESSNNMDEMNAIGQIGTNRYDANEKQFGGQDWTKVWERLSVADNNGGDKKYNRGAPENLANLSEGECQQYKDAQRAAQRAVDMRGKSDDLSRKLAGYYWILGGHPKTQGLVIGATTFYNFFPGGKKKKK